MSETGTIPTTTWKFNEDEASQYTLAELNTELQKNLGINISQAEFDAIDMLDGTTNGYISDANLFALEGGSGNGFLTLNEFNKDTDTGVTTTSINGGNDNAVAWKFDLEKTEEDTYTFNELVDYLEFSFSATINEVELKAALVLSGWAEGKLVTDKMLRNLEGGSDNGILTLAELNEDTDIAVTTTTKNISFDYGKDAKGKNGAKDNTVFSLAAELEAALGTDIDERGLAALLGLKSLDQNFDDNLIKSKLDVGSRDTKLTMRDITTIQKNAATVAKTSTLPQSTYWDYDSDTKTEYTKQQFANKLRNMGLTVDTTSEDYVAIFADKKATDAEIRTLLDKDANGVLTQREAAPVAQDAKEVNYTSDGLAEYSNHRQLAISIYKSLYGPTENWKTDPRFKEIHDNVRIEFKGKPSISDEQILDSTLDSNRDGVIDLWVTDGDKSTNYVPPTNK